MSSQKIKFGDKEVDKKKLYSSKEAILLDSIDFSSRWKLNDTTYKYFCGYLIMIRQGRVLQNVLLSLYVLFYLK